MRNDFVNLVNLLEEAVRIDFVNLVNLVEEALRQKVEA